jgi:hypothetical protein
MKKTSLIITTLVVMLLTACSKKDKILTKTDMLTSGGWILTAVIADNDGNGSYETNEFINFFDCYTDNIWMFKSNGKLELHEGISKCYAEDPQTIETNWQLTNNETTLVINTDSYTVEELNSTTLKMKQALSGNRSSRITMTNH